MRSSPTKAAGAADMKPCASGIRTKAYMVDITDETHPFPVSTVAGAGRRLLREGRTVRAAPARRDGQRRDQPLRDKLAWVAYFNAGIAWSICPIPTT
jgi:hypothetical protein